jgi:hypothetical protein
MCYRVLDFYTIFGCEQLAQCRPIQCQLFDPIPLTMKDLEPGKSTQLQLHQFEANVADVKGSQGLAKRRMDWPKPGQPQRIQS